MVTVSANRKTCTFRLPVAYRRFIERGNRFIVSQSGDTLMLKQIQEKPWPAETGTTGEPMSLEEIDRIVHESRPKRSPKAQ